MGRFKRLRGWGGLRGCEGGEVERVVRVKRLKGWDLGRFKRLREL